MSEVEGDPAEGEEMPRGCKIVVKLREGCEEYCRKVRYRVYDPSQVAERTMLTVWFVVECFYP